MGDAAGGEGGDVEFLGDDFLGVVAHGDGGGESGGDEAGGEEDGGGLHFLWLVEVERVLWCCCCC